MSPSRTTTLTVALLLAAAVAQEGLTAQVGPGAADPAPGGWAPPSLGIRGGFDNKQQSSVLGAQLRIPVTRGGEFELMPSVDVTFLLGTKEYQYNVEAVYVLDGRAGGIYGGGGLGIRDGLFGAGRGRSTELGYTVVVGFRLVGLGLVVPQIEYRWVRISAAAFTYQQLTFGLNLALWQPGPPSR